MEYQTLTEALTTLRNSDRRITYIATQDRSRSVLLSDLYLRAIGILRYLQDRGIRRGDQLIVLLNNNERFIDVFWACLYGGIIPVPIAVGVSDEQRFKLFRVYEKLPNAFVYTDRPIWHRLHDFAHSRGIADVSDEMQSRCMLSDNIHDTSQPGDIANVNRDDVAFIQYSSGSTSEPKGIVLTHGNLLANIGDIVQAARFTPDDISLSWMPLTHDMGLIGFHLNMLVSQMHHYLMDTEVFIRRPLSWLQVASSARANILCSPNFGYRHFLRLFNKRQFDGADVDLSQVRLIFNGAEPISASLCEEFLRALEPYGLRRKAMFPVYGLAEASLAVSFPHLDRDLRWQDIDRGAAGMGDAVRSAPGDAQAMRCVSVGHAIGRCRMRIVGNDQRPLPDGTIGRILINGPNVTPGYYLDPGATEAAIDGEGWLDTGDLGFLEDGELFITGREKDVLFVNGQNFYAHDLEAVALQSGRLQLGKVAVGSYRDEGSDTDKVLVFVLHRGDLGDFVTLARDVTGYINEHTGAEVSEVVPVSRMLKTTSGKLQRFALVQAYLAGEFDEDRAMLQQLAASVERDEPVTNIERRLRDICDQALGDIRLGRHDNFFETGASSLKLIEIHEQIENAFPGRVELMDLFDFPTLAELAEFLEQRVSAV